MTEIAAEPTQTPLGGHTAGVPRVECEEDPKMPGRRAYRISGALRGTVQAVIDSLTNEALDAPQYGFANFIGPFRLPDGAYGALGEVIIKPEGAA